jgi:hypothetical protein
MSISLAWQSDNFGGLTPHQLEVLYAPIILEYALQKVGTLPTYPHESQSTGKYEAEMPDLKAFQFMSTSWPRSATTSAVGIQSAPLQYFEVPLGPIMGLVPTQKIQED